MYIKKTYQCGDVIEVHKTYSKRYGKKIPRGKNENRTPEDVKGYNEKEAERKLARIINANFKEGDIHLTETYRKDRRPDAAGAKALLAEFHRKARKIYAAAGLTYKYIAVTEYEHKAIHHHLVIPNIDVKLLLPAWPHGKLRTTYLDDRGDHTELAAYLLKETKETFRKSPTKKRWCSSKNLIHPKPKIEIIQADKWIEQPKPVKGFQVITDSIQTGVSPVTGMPYQRYKMKKIPFQKKGP